MVPSLKVFGCKKEKMQNTLQVHTPTSVVACHLMVGMQVPSVVGYRLGAHLREHHLA